MRVAGGVGSPKEIPLLGEFGHGEVLRHEVIVLYGRDFAVVLHQAVPGIPGGVCKEGKVLAVAGGPELRFTGVAPSRGGVLELTVVQHQAKLTVGR